jgi:hypothetical protein
LILDARRRGGEEARSIVGLALATCTPANLPPAVTPKTNN